MSLVSVLLPAYNAELYISDALQSVMSQTFKDIEIIVVNDGSTDGTLSVIEELMTVDERIKVFSKPNGGLIEALNYGLSKCSAEYICRMDADDRMLPERIQKQYDYIVANPSCAVVGCQLNVFSDSPESVKDTDPRPTKPCNVAYFLGYGCAIAGPAAFYKKSVILSCGGYSEKALSAEDYDLWSRIALQTKYEIANLPDVLYDYRLNEAGISFTTRQQQYETTVFTGDTYRKSWVKGRIFVVTPRQHTAWLKDCSHLNEEDKEDMMRIYYTVSSWYINDMRKEYPYRAKANSLLLRVLTRLYNASDRHYIGGVGDRHVPPNGGAQ